MGTHQQLKTEQVAYHSKRHCGVPWASLWFGFYPPEYQVSEQHNRLSEKSGPESAVQNHHQALVTSAHAPVTKQRHRRNHLLKFWSNSYWNQTLSFPNPKKMLLWIGNVTQGAKAGHLMELTLRKCPNFCTIIIGSENWKRRTNIPDLISLPMRPPHLASP